MHNCMWNRKGNYLFFPIGIVCLLTKGLLMGVQNLSLLTEGFPTSGNDTIIGTEFAVNKVG